MQNTKKIYNTYYKIRSPKNTSWTKENFILNKKWYRTWLRHIAKKIDLSTLSSKKIFEIGSGLGGVTSLLIETGAVVKGSEVSTDIIGYANKQLGRKIIDYFDIEKTRKFPFRAFHFIFAFEVLEHLHKPLESIIKIEKMLKKSGYFIGSSPYPYKKNLLDETHVNVKYPSEWKELFLEAGFTSVSVYPMSFLPYVWKIFPLMNIVIPFYIPFPGFVSTTLIIAKK